MFKIVRVPGKLEPFFGSLTKWFHWNHGEYFRAMVLAMAAGWGRRNVSALYRQWDTRKKTHRTRWNDFVKVCRWNPECALKQKAYELLGRLKPRPGDILRLVVDDSKKKKRGKRMEAVGWVHDPALGINVRGHLYVTAVIHFRGQVIPWGIRLYVKKEHCRPLGQTFRTITELAADLIRQFTPPEGVKVQVLFDSFYLCPVVVKACRRRGFRFVSTLKSNRNLYKGGRALKAGTYGPNLFRRVSLGHWCLHKSRGLARYDFADADWLEVSDLGRLHVVFSKKNGRGRPLGIATDDERLSATGVIQAYELRYGAIETFFKDTKQLLGLGQYQNGSLRAAVTHLHLVCFAYALLTHIAIDREGEKGKSKMKRAAPLSTEGRQNELRRIVWQDLVDHLRHFRDADDFARELGQLLIA